MTYERGIWQPPKKAERMRRAGQFDAHIVCDGCKTGGIGGFCATQEALEIAWVKRGGLVKDGLHFHATCAERQMADTTPQEVPHGSH